MSCRGEERGATVLWQPVPFFNLPAGDVFLFILLLFYPFFLHVEPQWPRRRGLRLVSGSLATYRASSSAACARKYLEHLECAVINRTPRTRK